MLVNIIILLFKIYFILLLCRIMGSWAGAFGFHGFARSRFMQFIGFYTDPYLNIFRRIIPPIGVLDISPLIAFFALQFLQYFITLLLR